MRRYQKAFVMLDVIAAIFVTSLGVAVISSCMSLLLKRVSTSASETKIALASAAIIEKLANGKTRVSEGEESGVKWQSVFNCSKFTGKNEICEITLLLKSGGVEHVIVTYVDQPKN
jgi:hypothetical protein